MAKKLNLKEFKGRAFTTPLGRLAFPYLFEAKSYQDKIDAKKYYNTTILFTKDSDLKDMILEINRTAAEVFGKDSKKWPKIRMPWRDGDKKEDLIGYPGCRYVSAKSLKRVKIVDGQKKEVTDEEEVYGGRYARLAVRAKVTVSGSDDEGNPKYFVSLYLQGVQVTSLKGDKGENFAGGLDVDSAFKSDEDETADYSNDSSDGDEENEEESYGF